MKNFGLSMLLVLALASMAAADAELVSITGTVVSATDQVMVLKTATGQMTFDIDKDTERPGGLPVNSRVTVWYDSDDDPADKVDARRITMAPAAPAPAPTTGCDTAVLGAELLSRRRRRPRRRPPMLTTTTGRNFRRRPARSR